MKHSAKTLVRAPGLALAVLLTIAIGVGSNAAVLGFVRGFVTRDLPLADIDRMVSVFTRHPQEGFGPLSSRELLALEDRTEIFERLGAVRESHADVVLDDQLSVRPVATMTPEIADLLDLPGAGVVISDRLWRTERRRESGAMNQPIRIDGVEMQVAGVAPEWLEGLYVDRAIDIWLPEDTTTAAAIDPRSRTLWALGRLRPGVSIDRAQDALNAAGTAGESMAVQRYTGVTPEVGAGLARVNQTLVAAAGAVFLMACANVAAFLLSRSSARSHETSVRVALGASRAQLRRQLLSDSVVLALAGGGLGMLLAFWTTDIIPALFFDQDAEALVFAPDLAAIVAAAGGCAAVMVVCGLAPAFQVRDDRPAAVLRRESGGPSNTMRRLRTGLVIAQMACCSLLVISTAWLIDGFRAALRTSSGDRLGEPMLATVDAQSGFDRPDLGLEYLQAAERAARSLPGILATAWVDTPPGSRASSRTLRVEQPDLPLQDVVMEAVLLTPESLDAIVLPPVAGRMFGGRDTPHSCRVAIVNDAAAERFFENDAVGRSIEDPTGRRVEIVGVVSMRKKAVSRPLIYYYAEQTALPLNSSGPARFRVPARSTSMRAVLASHVVSSAYFDAMNLSITAGRVFDDRADAGACRVAVLSDEAAALYFGGHAVGGAVIDPSGQRTAIVGVVQSSLLRISQRRSAPAVYLPVFQDFVPRMTLIAGAPSADDERVRALRGVLTGVNGGTVRRVMSLEEHLSRTALAPERIAATLVGVSALMALALGVLGMYSAMADSTRQRRREIALRIALGVRSWRLIRQVLVEGLMLAGGGTLAGVLGSILVARWLEVSLRAAQPGWSVFVLAPLVLIAAVVVAGVLPVRRALAVDPLSLMRDS